MVLSANEWAVQQWGNVDLGDLRLNRRAVALGSKLAAQPEASLPQQMADPNELEAAYNFLNNRYVSLAALLAPHRQQTLAQARHSEVVLWIEDTTELDFSAHKSMTGLGPIGDGRGRGLLLHSTLGLLPQTRTLLGLGHVQVVLREPRPKQTIHWRRSAEARVWEVSAQAIARPPEGVRWVHVSDSGSDIFEYLATCADLDKHFLVRVYHNRLLTWGEELPEADQAEARKLIDYARSLPAHPEGGYAVQVAARPRQPAREAQVVLAWAPVTLPPPERAPLPEHLKKPLKGWVLRVWEPQPPPGVEGLEWILVSSLPIGDLAAALERVDWYTCRWLCEDFHQCLKTGCQIEKSQLDDGQDIQRLLGLVTPIATRLLQLRQVARNTPQVPAQEVVDPLMVEVLARREQLPADSLTAKEFFRWVARLGGFQGRKRDGEPGWRTLWHGWRYLSDLTEGARLFLSHDTS